MTATTYRSKQLRADLKALSAICEFARKDDPDGIEVEHLFRVMGERKSPRIWSDIESAALLDKIRAGLPILASVLYDPTSEIRFKGVPTTYGTLDGEDLFVGRITSTPSDLFTLEVVTDGAVKLSEPLPLILIRAAELAAHLPVNTLRICKDEGCDAVFASTRSNKFFCNMTCRGRHNTRNHRERWGPTKGEG